MARRSTEANGSKQPGDGKRDAGVEGPDLDANHETVRKCIVSGELKAKQFLIRFVVDPHGEVVPDLEERLPGRGLWLSAEPGVIQTACDKNRFARAAKCSVKVPEDLPERLEGLLVRRCLNLIGMARRAGAVVAGFEKVRARLKSGKAGVLLAASDGASDGRDKIRALAPQAPLLDIFSSEELGQALGREHVVHAVIFPGGLAERLIREAGKVAGFRPQAIESHS